MFSSTPPQHPFRCRSGPGANTLDIGCPDDRYRYAGDLLRQDNVLFSCLQNRILVIGMRAAFGGGDKPRTQLDTCIPQLNGLRILCRRTDTAGTDQRLPKRAQLIQQLL